MTRRIARDIGVDCFEIGQRPPSQANAKSLRHRRSLPQIFLAQLAPHVAPFDELTSLIFGIGLRDGRDRGIVKDAVVEHHLLDRRLNNGLGRREMSGLNLVVDEFPELYFLQVNVHRFILPPNVAKSENEIAEPETNPLHLPIHRRRDALDRLHHVGELFRRDGSAPSVIACSGSL
jgi:hypothetical protein